MSSAWSKSDGSAAIDILAAHLDQRSAMCQSSAAATPARAVLAVLYNMFPAWAASGNATICGTDSSAATSAIVAPCRSAGRAARRARESAGGRTRRARGAACLADQAADPQDLRVRPPLAASAWVGIRDALEFGSPRGCSRWAAGR